MAALTLRRYREDDAERVRELHETAMRELEAFVDDLPDVDLNDVHGSYVEPGGDFLVGEVDGEVVAMGAFRPVKGYLTDLLSELPPATAEVKRMRVDPAWQGQGFGGQLLTALEERARERGFTHLVLDTTAAMEAAQGLYESHGFELVRRVDVAFGGDALEMLCYRKSLGERD
ncbi:Ribosomal protein S18 acetylase RimI [Halogranum gelatinilyticum]|uniref:Ribosomal protein S18 acetylase RimI n=1 Tax=Halogranum gelatinilyticum TaxID=660521 RepID=A0A1G9R0A1_9EURY|nr:GNAT family N-acetyltransferase [Halogranum gelatinilyticum]SDM16571.1 Ribosomal protein S18 acetylase RimI [Halogranum gelatinilyticum]